MKLAQTIGLCIVFASISLVMAGGGLGLPKKEDVPKYLKMLLTSKTPADRAMAAEMLGKRGGINSSDVEEAVEPLQKSLQKDIDAKVRAAAARALGNIHLEPKDTVPLLIERLSKDSAMEVKMASVVALGQYGADAKDAVPPLRELAKKFDAKKSKEGQTIMSALQAIGAAKKKKN